MHNVKFKDKMKASRTSKGTFSDVSSMAFWLQLKAELCDLV